MEANLVLFIFKGITHPPAPIFFRSIQNTSYSPTLSFSESIFASINEVLGRSMEVNLMNGIVKFHFQKVLGGPMADLW